MKVEGKLGYERVWCPKCGKEMLADLHAPPEFWEGGPPSNTTFDERLAWDNWICVHCDVVIVRDDL